MFSAFTSLSLLLLVQVQVQDVRAEKGIIGFGRTIYPDLCCLSCYYSLSSLYLSCTTFPDMSGMDMDMESMMSMGTTSDECRTSNTPWLESMAYCIDQACAADGYSLEEKEQCFSKHAVAGASVPTFRESLPDTDPTVELPEHVMWLNVTSRVNKHTYHVTYGTMGVFRSMEYAHTRYSMILYILVIGVCLIWGIKKQLSSLFPSTQRNQRTTSRLASKIRAHITLPALLGSRHQEPLPWNLGYVPERGLSIVIAVYVSLNVIFSSVSFESFQPNIWWTSEAAELCEYVGNRTGILSLVNMSLAILFAGRNNILIAVTGWSQTTFLALHRWTARVAAVQAVVHSIVYTLIYFEPGYEGAKTYAEKAAEPYYWWGIIGTIALCLATAFAILPIRMNFYEFFLITHIILIILSLVACWYHLVPHFSFKYGYQAWLYICFGYWSIERLARLARIAYYNRLGDAKATVEEIPGCNILHVTVFPRVARGVGPGQHTFLYFPGLGKFWESHPFSIAGWETTTTTTHRGQLRQRQQQSASVSAHLPTSEIDGSGEGSGEEKYSVVKESQVGVKNEAAGDAYYNRSTKPSAATATTATLTATSATTNGITHSTNNEAHKYNDVCFHLLIRAHSGMTASLHRYLSSPSFSSKVEVSVYTEGYYAGHRASLQPLYTTDTVLCLIGGLGITHALGFVQAYVDATRQALPLVGGEGEGGEVRGSRGLMGRTRRFILAWSAREMPFIDHVRHNFLADAPGVEALIWYTGQSRPDSAVQLQQESTSLKSWSRENGHVDTASAAITAGRMDIASVVRSSVEAGRQTTVLVCGPGQMADETRKHVVACIKDGFRMDLVEEAFAW